MAVAWMQGFPWFQVRGVTFDEIEELVPRLSAALGCDVIGFASQTAVDAFLLVQASGGRLVRILDFGAFGEERTWNRVEGAPQAWEAEAFWAEDSLTEANEQLEDMAEYEDEAVMELNRKAIAERTLIPGATLPFLGTLDTVHIGATIGLPGFYAEGHGDWSTPVEFKTGPPGFFSRLFTTFR